MSSIHVKSGKEKWVHLILLKPSKGWEHNLQNLNLYLGSCNLIMYVRK